MAVPVWLLAPWSTLLAIVTGALVYGAALLALRTLTAEERAELRSLVRR
jgi:hypothetical protein